MVHVTIRLFFSTGAPPRRIHQRPTQVAISPSLIAISLYIRNIDVGGQSAIGTESRSGDNEKDFRFVEDEGRFSDLVVFVLFLVDEVVEWLVFVRYLLDAFVGVGGVVFGG
ncbi:hypothetical protein ACHAXS_000320 [Conticribra weissflogii]